MPSPLDSDTVVSGVYGVYYFTLAANSASFVVTEQ